MGRRRTWGHPGPCLGLGLLTVHLDDAAASWSTLMLLRPVVLLMDVLLETSACEFVCVCVCVCVSSWVLAGTPKSQFYLVRRWSFGHPGPCLGLGLLTVHLDDADASWSTLVLLGPVVLLMDVLLETSACEFVCVCVCVSSWVLAGTPKSQFYLVRRRSF